MSTRFIQGTPVNYQGRTDGAAVPAGQIGEIVSATSTTAITTSFTNLATVTLNRGLWTVTGMTNIGADATTRYVQVSISTTSATADTVIGRRFTTDYHTAAGGVSAITFPRTLNITADGTVVYLVGITSSVSGLSSTNSYLEAVRIA